MYRNATPSRVDQKWNEQKKRLQIRFTNLTDEDLHFETGRKHEMIKRISVKLEKSETEMNHIFQAL
jgi:hypothetical protein